MLACHSCGFSNLPRAIFCGGCGQLLNATVCPLCHTANPRVNRFCNQCGSHISPSTIATEETLAESSPSSLSERTPIHAFPRASSLPISLLFPHIRLPIHARALADSASALLARRSTPLLVFGALAVALAQLGLTFSVELNEKAPIGYLLLLALGVGAFALGSFGLWIKRAADRGAPSDMPFSTTRGPRVFDSITGTLGLLIGVLAMAALLIPLGAGAISGYMLLPWIVALATFASPFLPQLASLRGSSSAWIRRHYADVLLVLSVMALFVGLNLYDLQDWYYSAIGDEFLFFEHAKHMTEEGITRPFSQEGVYNHHPVMSTVYQAVIMWVFGADYFGWTFSSLLSAALTIPGIYLLGHTLSGRKAALVAAILFAASHYMLAGTHTGNTVLNPLPVAVWSLALFVLGWRKGNPLLLYAAGIAAGLGFYTHYSGRVVLPVILPPLLPGAVPAVC